jgi:2-C-methyl-D-erythritol 2,4-cyclodiphosphate synthase
VVNVDTIIICEHPKLSPHYQAIRTSLSHLLKIEPLRVSVKAKTAEKLGDIGAGKAIAVQAVVLLESI